MAFIDKLLSSSRKNNSLLCIGLDPDVTLMPKIDPLDFNKAIIDATADLVCSYKPNLAFYETLGLGGLKTLLKTAEYIPDYLPVIGDGKRGDIGNTAKAYARALFEIYGFDAATVSPYMGYDSVRPFIEYSDKGVFILCRTSNPGAVDFQSLADAEGRPLYEAVALKAREWNAQSNIGLVIGATYPNELKAIRRICSEMPILIPGIGAQGGDLASTVKNGIDAQGEKAIISVSRQILYASTGKDFAQAARSRAQKLRNDINAVVSQVYRKQYGNSS
jgi:orotidine-5'-phosphate decarboxylase